MNCSECGIDENFCSRIILNAYLTGSPLCCICSEMDEEDLCGICSRKFELVLNVTQGKKVIFPVKESKKEGWPGILAVPLIRKEVDT